jgi:hypothetical protein
MKNMVKQIGIASLVLAMVFAMAVIGCGSTDDDGGDDVLDTALNGTWGRTNGSNTWSFTYNDGNFEQSYNGNKLLKGTYKTKDGVINYTITHIHGDGYKTSLGLTESKWYSKQEVLTELKLPSGDTSVNNLFERAQANYSVEGDTLTLGGPEYTKTP